MNEGEFISAAVVTYNDRDDALRALKSLLENTKKYPLRLYAIDNASSDQTADAASELDGVRVIRLGRNSGFGAAHNRAIAEGLGKYHFVVNPDIEIASDVLSDMADFMDANPGIAMAMPDIRNADGTAQHLPKERPTFRRLFLGRLAPLGGIFRKIRDSYVWSDRTITKPTDIDFCSGCFFCIRSEVFEKLGGFDERFFMYLEDADLSLRAKEYGRVVVTPAVSVSHLWQRESAKRLKYLLIHVGSSFKFLKKWSGIN